MRGDVIVERVCFKLLVSVVMISDLGVGTVCECVVLVLLHLSQLWRFVFPILSRW